MLKPLQVLLVLFKSYKPECVPEDIPAISIYSAFKKPNINLLARFKNTQKRRSRHTNDPHLSWINPINCGKARNKKSDEQLVPNVVFITSDRDQDGEPNNFLNLSDPASMVKLSVHHSMSRPAQLRALLSNTVGQVLLAIEPHTEQAFLAHDLTCLLHSWIQVQGCLFHFVQALLRRARQEGIRVGRNSPGWQLVQLYVTLALLAAAEVPLGLAELPAIAAQESLPFNEAFYGYFGNQWMTRVGEIFREAGIAFNKLSEMTNLLHPMGESQPSGKWTDEEIDMLRSCVHRFALDLNKLSQHVKSRTVSQIRTTLKKKAFEDAGLPVRQVNSIQGVGQPHQQVASPMTVVNTQSVLGNALSGMGNTVLASPQSLLVSSQGILSSQSTHGVLGKNAEVTLNMLNATENEVDVEGLSTDGVKLEFEANNDEVAT